MLSLLQSFVVSLTFPLTLSLWLLGAGAILLLLRRRKAAVALTVFAVGWSLIWSIPQASDWLRGHLEFHYPKVNEETLPKADAIVVLGGGQYYGWLKKENVRLSDLESSRVAAGARAWLAGRAPVIILTGGKAGRISEAQRMAEAINRLGVPDSALLLEERSRSTRENAQYTAALAKPRSIRTVLLVTSGLHMPRAALVFREAGFHVVPVPVPERARRMSWVRSWLPSPSALWRSGRAMKEFAALAATYLQSKADTSM
ncbi:YdcF family protein [Pseudoxanthomonas sp. UTMC 1351]|uniref:YdcF family protein n=1 Tax=Pseudoxanthomonas sp. UTMC 1351 TaxID=2695853 RepID=UPI0034CD23B3